MVFNISNGKVRLDIWRIPHKFRYYVNMLQSICASCDGLNMSITHVLGGAAFSTDPQHKMYQPQEERPMTCGI
jgi:hypothetical protein